MKKYIVYFVILSFYVIPSCKIQGSDNHRLPAGWKAIEEDMMSPDELLEYMQNRRLQLKQSVEKEMMELQQSPHDEIGKKALVHVTQVSESWPQSIARFVMRVLRQ